ncbi:MAG: AI-2E family transporter [Spirochaetota bacterium]
MNNEDQWQTIYKFTAFLIAAIAIVFVLKTLSGIFIPLVLAVFFAYLFAPVVEFFARFKIPRILTLFIILGIISLAGVFITQIVMDNIRSFIELYPTLESKMITSIAGFLRDYFNIEAANLQAILQSTRVREILTSFVNKSVAYVGYIALTILILIFIYLTYHNYPGLIKKAFRDDDARYVFGVMKNINEQIIRYLYIKTIVSGGTGILTAVACYFFGIRFAVLWGFLAFLLNYIPYVGSFVAVIFPILLSFLQFPDSYMPLFAGVSLFGIQLFMGSILDPQMMGSRFNLSPILIVLSLVFWSYVWGPIGAFLAVPITAVIKIVIQNIRTFHFISVLMSKKAD